MYQFVAGFMCGVYLGTRYDLEVYVNAVEHKVASLATDLDKRKKTQPIEEPVALQTEPKEEQQEDSGFINRFFSVGKKSP